MHFHAALHNIDTISERSIGSSVSAEATMPLMLKSKISFANCPGVLSGSRGGGRESASCGMVTYSIFDKPFITYLGKLANKKPLVNACRNSEIWDVHRFPTSGWQLPGRMSSATRSETEIERIRHIKDELKSRN